MNKTTDEVPFRVEFRRSLIALVIPIAFQNLILAAVNTADVIMLGTIGQSAMSAVSLANQITFILMFFLMGLAIGAGILAAQYWGKKDTEVIRRVLSIACVLSICISFVFFIASILFSDSLMRIFTSDPEFIRYGAKYQRVLSISYLAMGLSQMYLSVVKSMEKVRFSAAVSTASLIVNISINALCIFVLFPGQPDKAIIGVATATVISRFIELICCAAHSMRDGNIRFALPVRDAAQKVLLQDYLKYTLPAMANYVVYGGALVASAAIIGHVSSDLVAANAIANVIRNLAIVLCGGISAGGSVLIGKYLGSGNLQAAKKAGNTIYLYALIFGVLAGASVLLARPFVFGLVEINAVAQGYLDAMLIVCAVYCIGKSLNSTIIGGVFCAGGDAKFGFWCDLIVMWGIIIPLAWICAFVWHVSPILLYAVICFDEAIKSISQNSEMVPEKSWRTLQRLIFPVPRI
ncbi:MAG: MATE family efflux transporter [Clostridiales bacterium]|nr:MATE family efflux transporter [Clostridiales bacterium]